MAVGDLVRSYTTEERTKVRIFSVHEDPPGFAAFVRLALNREDEWGLFAFGGVHGAADDPLEHFESWVRHYWGRVDDENDEDFAYQLRRNIAFGVKWADVVRDPLDVAARQQRVYDNLTPQERNWLEHCPIETARELRRRFRGQR